MSGGGHERGLAVGLLSPCFWPEVRRGAERFVRELADGLIERGHRPWLVTSHPGAPSRTVEDGLPIVRHWRPPEWRLRRRGFEEHLTHLPFSYLSLARGAPDVAHAVYPADGMVAARWSERTGRPSILSYMGIPDHPGLCARRYRLEITLRAVEGCTAVVALSNTAAEAFRRWLGIEARVIHPGVDLRTFRPGGPRDDRPTVFCAAAITEPRKRVGLLAEAVRLVRRERPDTRLLLSRPRDPAAVGRAIPEDAPVELVDVDDRHDLARTYARSWVSVLPSYGEAFGLVLVEALACGTPVVGSNRDGIAEVVDRDTIGRLFDGEDPHALASAIMEALELAGDPGTPAACRARAEEFSTERCVEEYEALYRELLARRAD